MTKDEEREALRPVIALCREHRWNWRWETELRGTHWHADVKVTDQAENMIAWEGTSGIATSFTEPDILAHAAKLAKDEIERNTDEAARQWRRQDMTEVEDLFPSRKNT